MGLFDNLFGRKKSQARHEQPAPFKPATLPPKKEASGDLSKDPNLIKVFDGYGREMFITKEQWRANVLPSTLKENWNNAEQLGAIVIGALNDGFFPDVLNAAKQLHHIDSVPSRGACVYGIALMKNKRLDDAEKVFRNYIEKHGEEGSVLTNLAKVYSERNEHEKAMEILWRSLQVDPNLDNGLMWFAAVQREKGGPEAAMDALRRVAALPGSWRAQLWLARDALQTRKLDEALKLYEACLSRVGKPVPEDLLMQMSGDLGNTGHLPEILQLVEPYFDIHAHGLRVGNNLIKAHLDLGQIDAARRILDQLYALNRVDWKQTLSFWDTEISKAKVALSGRVAPQDLKMAMLTVEGPIWLKPSSPAAELFPVKAKDTLIIAFLGGSAEIPTNSKRIERQMADDRGRFSRALPLFLAEQIEFQSSARTQTIVPWITNEGGGFALCGTRWKDDEAANYSRQGQIKSDYVVTSYLKTSSESWAAELRLIRAIDGKCLGTAEASFSSAKPQETIPDLAQELLALLSQDAEVETQPSPSVYQILLGEQLPFYLLRLEQLLAVRCGGMDGVPHGFLTGEREILDGNIQLCLAEPENVCTRILLAQTVIEMKRVRPDILPEFREKITLLQREKPLPEPAKSVVQRMFNEALSA
jgi:tetratricopeptide (TPR) repeat protein